MSEPLKIVDPYYSIIKFPAAELPKQYESLIFAKWLRSLRFGNPFFKLIDAEPYYQCYHMFIEAVLKRPNAMVRLAALSDDHDVVLGFSICRGHVLDYVHVQVDQRKQGIGKKLIPEDVRVITHITNTAMDIWTRNRKYQFLKFNPFA